MKFQWIYQPLWVTFSSEASYNLLFELNDWPLYICFLISLSFVLQVVPNTRSRSQMGETTDGGLYEIFQQDYGPVGSPSFEAARENFIISSAGYAVASLLLQPKDRHNGNLLFDKYDLSRSSPLILLLVNILNDLSPPSPLILLLVKPKT